MLEHLLFNATPAPASKDFRTQSRFNTASAKNKPMSMMTIDATLARRALIAGCVIALLSSLWKFLLRIR